MWREQMQQGSLNGVPFHTRSSEFTFGRRAVTHTYPMRDIALVEDMGRSPRQFTLEMIVIGSDYMALRDALIAECERGGALQLIHPYFGALQVNITDSCSCRETSREGGMAVLTVPVIEVSDRVIQAEFDTTGATLAAISDAERAIAASFGAQYKTTGPAYIANNAATRLGNMLGKLKSINNRLSALQNPFNTAAQMLDDIQSEVSTLIRQPLMLASSMQAVLVTLLATGNEVDAALAAYNNISASMPLPVGMHVTPLAKRDANNILAERQTFAGQALMAATRSITLAAQVPDAMPGQSPFSSYQHAQHIVRQVQGALDGLSATADDDSYTAMRALSAAFNRHIQRHGVQLNRVRYYTPATRLPALVIAHNLYGDATRDEDLIRRNNLRHPLFVADQQLEVLDG